MKLDPEAHYQHLRNLALTIPDLKAGDWASPEIRMWFGRVAAYIEASGEFTEASRLRAASEYTSTVMREGNVQTIVSILYNALAKAELAAPAGLHGSFIPVGEPFSALSAVSKVLGTATQSVMIVDPYADSNLLTDFAVLVSERVQVLVLADQAGRKPGLAPAATSWAQQYQSTRPLEVRLAPARSLHDRLMILDEREAWTLGQSFNALATRAPTSILRADPETAKMKVEAYQQIWAAASPLS